MSSMKNWHHVRSGYGSSKADWDIVTNNGGRVASTPYEDVALMIAAIPNMIDALNKLCSRGIADQSTMDAARIALRKAGLS